MKSAQKNVAMMIGGGVILVAVGFGGGVAYQKGQKPSVANGMPTAGQQQFGQRRGINGRNFNGARGGNLVGTIISEDATSLTIKTNDGSTHTVNFDSSTNFYTESKGSSSDATTNKTVMVSGTPNSNGSVTAQTVRVQ